VQLGNATLYLGDSLTVMQQLESAQFAGVITDPPYSSGGTHTGQRQQPTTTKYTEGNHNRPAFSGDNRDQRSYLAWSNLWMSEARRLTAEGGVLASFIDWRQLPTLSDAIQAAGWIWRGMVAWDKTNCRPQPGRFRNQCEYLLWGSNGPMSNKRNAPVMSGCYRIAPPTARQRIHQTEKPVALMENLLPICEPDRPILEPFMGSGATVIAALNAGRKIVAIESDPAIFNAAVARIEQHLLQQAA
jgi:site-specific DNA-methyltransferase (adenine-specific)